jgi:hypothetical protein
VPSGSWRGAPADEVGNPEEYEKEKEKEMPGRDSCSCSFSCSFSFSAWALAPAQVIAQEFVAGGVGGGGDATHFGERLTGLLGNKTTASEGLHRQRRAVGREAGHPHP